MSSRRRRERIERFMEIGPGNSETMVFDPATGKLMVQNKSAATREQEKIEQHQLSPDKNQVLVLDEYTGKLKVVERGVVQNKSLAPSEQERLEQHLLSPDKNRVVVLDDYTGKIKVVGRAEAERNQSLPAGRRQVMLGMHDDDGGGFFLKGRHEH